MKPTVIKNPLNSLKQIDLAAIFGVTDRTIRNWDAEGLPGNGEGRDRRYDWARVLPWYVARVSGSKEGDEAQTDKTRRERAEADLAEMRRDQESGRLVVAAEMQAATIDLLTRLRSNLRGFPARLVDRLQGVTDHREQLAIGRREMDATLRDLVAEIQKGEGE